MAIIKPEGVDKSWFGLRHRSQAMPWQPFGPLHPAAAYSDEAGHRFRFEAGRFLV
ncbi:hypothetical protein [Mesorhizobium sp.]|uniref:hypothetical protein n=1 Tax=Mesorhizobium sp. TaxID=1871066 RepID=UPI0025F0885D|nr:hypothetical protein [Mesorhizobium sp.]